MTLKQYRDIVKWSIHALTRFLVDIVQKTTKDSYIKICHRNKYFKSHCTKWAFQLVMVFCREILLSKIGTIDLSFDFLTHLFPMHPFSTPWKHQVFWRFQKVGKSCFGKWFKKSWKEGDLPHWINESAWPSEAVRIKLTLLTFVFSYANSQVINSFVLSSFYIKAISL